MDLFGSESGKGPTITFGEELPPPARIKVVGVGGGGGNAVNRMIQSGIRGVEFIAANTDLQVLRVNRASMKLQLGLNTARGMGAGNDPRKGRDAALEDAERILESIGGADMVFVTAGMGGGTGTGAAPVVAKIASETGALVVAIVSKPFAFEGRRKLRQAEEGIAELREIVDTLITIPNERLIAVVDRNVTAWDAFRQADDVLRQAVQGISELITVPGYVNVDFADVKAVMENMGMALMGTGSASGENRAVEAAQRAISNPLLEEQSIQGARAILINVTGGPDLSMAEFNEACSVIQQAADEDANIIPGLVRDDTLQDEVKVSVIATGFDAPIADSSRVGVKASPRGESKSRPEPEPPAPDYPVNWISAEKTRAAEDYLDIPTFLRRQMD